jgi:hypothetical protein
VAIRRNQLSVEVADRLGRLRAHRLVPARDVDPERQDRQRGARDVRDVELPRDDACAELALEQVLELAAQLRDLPEGGPRKRAQFVLAAAGDRVYACQLANVRTKPRRRSGGSSIPSSVARSSRNSVSCPSSAIWESKSALELSCT